MGHLSSENEAVLALVDTRKRETCPDMAAGFGVGLATARRYTQETVGFLAAQTPALKDTQEGLRTVQCCSSAEPKLAETA